MQMTELVYHCELSCFKWNEGGEMDWLGNNYSEQVILDYHNTFMYQI